MDAVDEVMNAMDAIGRELDGAELRPDPAREDWASQAERLEETRAKLEADVLAKLREATDLLASEGPVAQQNVRDGAAFLAAELGAAFQASGDRSTAGTLLVKALRAGPSGAPLAELEAASKEPDAWVSLALGRWHHRRGDFSAGDAVLKAGKRAAQDRSLRASFDRSLNGPRPMTGGAPSLFTFNGIGTMLYGARDRRDDGSHVATLFLCLIYIPVLALSAYRVVDHGNGSYTFFTKERLSGATKGWNWAIASALVLAIGWGVTSSYLGSPGRLARVALEEAELVEERGDLERAAEAYQGVVDEHRGVQRTVRDAATGLMRVLTARVETPMTAARADEGVQLVRRYRLLPDHAQQGERATILARALGEWSEQIGEEDDAARRAALRLAELGAQVAGETEVGATLRARVSALHLAMAAPLREAWPLEALHHYVAADTPEAMQAADALVRELDASRLPDVAAEVAAWEASGDADEAAVAHVRALRAQREEWAGDARRTDALASGDAEALALLHGERPDDQEVGAALAEARRGAGQTDEALAILTAYGPPGRLCGEAQRTLASCYADQGELERAAGLLSRQVELRLPGFQEAQLAYDSASQARVDALVERARAGRDMELNRRLENVFDDARGREIFDAWLRERIEGDAELTTLHEAYLARSSVVPMVLSLGTLQLRRAREVSGEAREALLADAERLFLAIRQEAAGVPSYHLSLGQVYHRLGRTAEGDAELTGLLESGDLGLALQVGHVYRNLGLVERAREVAEDVHARGAGSAATQDVAGAAAHLMALMATTLEDRETWLRRAPQELPEVETALLEVRAERALQARELREADALFAQVAQRYASAGDNDAASQNNAALADQQRYRCTGDPAHLVRAGERMERGLRLMPDDALMVGNLAAMESYRGDLAVLDGFVRTSILRLDSAQTGQLLGWLSLGPQRDAAREALRTGAHSRRARELTRQEQVLAPQRARAWVREWQWAAEEDDVDALRALLARLREVDNLDTSRQVEARTRELTAEQEARLEAERDAAVADAEALVADARRARHPATLSAALHLHAVALVARAWESASVEDARAGVAAAREGAATWDGFGAGELPWALRTLAALEVMSAQPALQAAYDARGPADRLDGVMEQAAERDAAVAAAFRESATLDEACALRAAAPPSDLGLADVTMAQLAGHDGLGAAARVVTTRPRAPVELDIWAQVDPDNPEIPRRRALLGG